MPKMIGPAFTEGKELVERDVPDADVGAFTAAGYKLGTLPPELKLKAAEMKKALADEQAKADAEAKAIADAEAAKAKAEADAVKGKGK